MPKRGVGKWYFAFRPWGSHEGGRVEMAQIVDMHVVQLNFEFLREWQPVQFVQSNLPGGYSDVRHTPFRHLCRRQKSKCAMQSCSENTDGTDTYSLMPNAGSMQDSQ
jgi:hypothetical protein